MAKLTDKAKSILEALKRDYRENDVCMGDLLSASIVTGYDKSGDISFEDAFEIYMEAMKWAEGDQFFHKLGTEEGLEEL